MTTDEILVKVGARGVRVNAVERYTSLACGECGETIDTHVDVRITGSLSIAGHESPLDIQARICHVCFGHMQDRARLSPLWRDTPFTLEGAQ